MSSRIGRMLRIALIAAPLSICGVALAQAGGGGGPPGGSAGSEGGGTNPNVDTGGTSSTHKDTKSKRSTTPAVPSPNEPTTEPGRPSGRQPGSSTDRR